MTEEKLFDLEDMDPNEPKQVTLSSGLNIAVYFWEGEYYATDDLCTHGEASLSDGEIEYGSIVCPFHLGSFCIKTGEATGAPCVDPVKTHQVEVRGGALFYVPDAG